MEANLLVTYEPAHAGKAKEEVESALKEVEATPEFLESIPGVFQLSIANPKAVVKKLRELCKKSPEKFVVTYHYIPIDKWCPADLAKMQALIGEIQKGIEKEEKWKMNLNKRQFKADSRELIIKLTDPVDKPNVDLTNPDKIIQVEIVGDKAGIALLNKDELLEVPKMK